MTGGSPYKGLTYYTEDDADVFFGREREAGLIVANLLAARLTVVYGASGVGKSSLLRAGVEHRLRREATGPDGSLEFLPVVVNAWRDDPLAGIAAAIEASARSLSADPPPAAPAAGTGLVELLEHWTGALDCDVLLILDQFEEFFLYHGDEEGPGTLLAELPRVLDRGDLRVNVLLSLREDALARLDVFKGRIRTLFDNYLRIEHLDRDAARSATVGPVERYNETAGAGRVELEPGLVDVVLDEVRAGRVTLARAGRGGVAADGGERIETPYLQLVLTRLWDAEREAGSSRLRLATLRRLGGAERIVRTHLDAALSTLTPAEQEVAAAAFHHLVTPSGTKIAHAASDLAQYVEQDEAEVEAVLEQLAGAPRILRPVAPPPGSASGVRYEIFHDVLAPAVLDWRTRFAHAASERKLAESLKLQRRERHAAERRARRFLAVAVAACVFLVASLGLAGYAYLKKQDAKDQRRQVAAFALAVSNLDRRLDTALVAGVAAYAMEPSTANRDVLTAALGRAARVRGFRYPGQGPLHDVAAAAGRSATAGEDGTAVVWDEAGRVIRRIAVGDRRVSTVLLDREAKSLYAVAARAGRESTPEATRWDVRTGRRIGRAVPIVGPFAIDVARSRVVQEAPGNLLQLQSLDRDAPPVHVRSPHASVIYRLAFSADGRRLATSDVAGRVVLWRSDGERPVVDRRLTEEGQAVSALAFDPAGQLLAGGGRDGTVVVWRVQDGTVVARLSQHAGWVTQLAFSPDGRTLASASGDTVALADAGTGRPLGDQLRGHGDPVSGLAFLSGSTLASVAGDGRLVLWRADGEIGTPLAVGGPAATLAFAQGGTLLALAASDRIALVDVTTGREVASFPALDARALAVSPDSTLVAATDLAGGVLLARLERTAGGRPRLVPLPGRLLPPASDARRFGSTSIESLAFADEGRLLAGGTADGRLAVWEVASRKRLRAAQVGVAPVSGLAVAPDGRLAVAGTFLDETAAFDVVSGKRVDIGLGETGGGTAAFAPDGTLALASPRGITLWDTKRRTRIGILRGVSRVTGLAFSREGTVLASVDGDGTIDLWNVAARDHTGTPIRLPRSQALPQVAIGDSPSTLAWAGPGVAPAVLAPFFGDDLAPVRRYACGLAVVDELPRSIRDTCT